MDTNESLELMANFCTNLELVDVEHMVNWHHAFIRWWRLLGAVKLV